MLAYINCLKLNLIYKYFSPILFKLQSIVLGLICTCLLLHIYYFALYLCFAYFNSENILVLNLYLHTHFFIVFFPPCIGIPNYLYIHFFWLFFVYKSKVLVFENKLVFFFLLNMLKQNNNWSICENIENNSYFYIQYSKNKFKVGFRVFPKGDQWQF